MQEPTLHSLTFNSVDCPAMSRSTMSWGPVRYRCNRFISWFHLSTILSDAPSFHLVSPWLAVLAGEEQKVAVV